MGPSDYHHATEIEPPVNKRFSFLPPSFNPTPIELFSPLFFIRGKLSLLLRQDLESESLHLLATDVLMYNRSHSN